MRFFVYVLKGVFEVVLVLTLVEISLTQYTYYLIIIFCSTEFRSRPCTFLGTAQTDDDEPKSMMFLKRVLEIVLLYVPFQLYVDLASLKFWIWQMHQGCPWQLSYVHWLSFDIYSLSILWWALVHLTHKNYGQFGSGIIDLHVESGIFSAFTLVVLIEQMKQNL